jgi:lysophospholipase L1-like esterase
MMDVLMPPTLRRRRRGLAALAVVITMLVLTACGGDGEPTAKGAVYAALGDSDAAGAGIAPVSDRACARSKVNYGSLVAAQLKYTSFKDVSCGGATTTDLTRPQVGTSNEPQLDAVGRRTRLVTISIGLNDKKVASALFYACMSPSGVASDWCRLVLGTTEAQTRTGLAQAASRLSQALRAIRKKAPDATVILVGYPRFLPDSGDCPDRVPFVSDMEPRVREALAAVNELWKQVATKEGAEYVDTYALTKGHDVCSADPWINGATDVPGKAAAMHPFAAFHRAVADAIVSLLEKS